MIRILKHRWLLAKHSLVIFFAVAPLFGQEPATSHAHNSLSDSGIHFLNCPVQSDTSAQKLEEPLRRGQARHSRKTVPEIAKDAKGAVVSIVMSDREGHPVAQGSGFFVTSDGWVMTNYHVIKHGISAVIKLPDGAFFAVDGVISLDRTCDVAVIKAHGKNFRTLTLGDSGRLQTGEEVVAIGNPLSLESTVSNGIVSGFRHVEDEGNLLQITAPISSGSSGGPLFNMEGEVVGITTSYLIGGENLNFALPIDDAKPMLATHVSTVQRFPDEPQDARQNQNDSGHQTIVLMDADAYKSSEVPKILQAFAADWFSSAFALEPSCNGLKLLRTHAKGFVWPSESWVLEVLPGKQDTDELYWSIAYDNNDVVTSRIRNVDDNPTEAVRHVCSLVKQVGGVVR